MARNIELPRRIEGAPVEGAIPSVVIVGRPNVGKSSLLNCLARERIAIVDPTAGVTRDRISVIVEHEGRLFELWDTGGVGTPDDLVAEVQTQIETALNRADLVLFVVDALDGLLPLDRDIALRLRRIGREVLLVANKVDHPKHEEASLEFFSLGFGPPCHVCALQGYGRGDLLAALSARLPESGPAPPREALKLAVVGRRNVGKSTLINTLRGETRVIVSDLPGTTRDAVDVPFERNGRSYVAVDTAGVKRKSRLADSIEFYSLARAYRAIRRCDVALMMLDVAAEIGRVDKQLAAAIERAYKPCVIVANKWDLAEGRMTTDDYVKYLNAHLAGLAFAPVSFISAADGIRVDDALRLAESLAGQSRTQVSTSELNRVLEDAFAARAPRGKKGKRPKLFYATQIGVAPPTFLVFASNASAIDAGYTRYLANQFRQHLPFPEVPLRIVYRERRSEGPKRNKNSASAPQGP